MDLKVGQSLQSAVDSTSVIVVQAPDSAVAVSCGGVDMYDPKSEGVASQESPHPDHMGGSQLGKRYVDEAGTVELLCIKAGDASLAVDGDPLRVKESKPLPSSD